MSLANVGNADRLIRIIIGILLVAAPYFVELALWENQTARILVQVVGGILVFTGVSRFCALYKLIGVNTKSS
ncbi:MAG: YgaP family membrane protein [bacterium]